MKHAVLFLFHECGAPWVAETCVEKVRDLKALNPDVAIFGVRCGTSEITHLFDEVNPYLDDLWVLPQDPPYDNPVYRWTHIDKLIAHWFNERGDALAWDALILHFWDMLFTEPLLDYVKITSQEEVYIYPKPLPVSELAELKWPWLGTPDFQRFKFFLDTFNPNIPIFGGVMAFATIPRSFFLKAGVVLEPLPGFLEYRLPTILNLLNYTLVEPPEPELVSTGHQTLNFHWDQTEIAGEVILNELENPTGCWLFHPVYLDYYQKRGSTQP